MFKISISIGVVRYDGNKPVAIDNLLSQADRKMYEEKRRKFKSSKHSSSTVFNWS